MSLLKRLDFVLAIFTLLGLRAIFVGAGIGDAILMLSVCMLFGFNNFLASKKIPDLSTEVKKELDEMKTYMSAVSIKHGIRDMPKELPKDKRFF